MSDDRPTPQLRQAVPIFAVDDLLATVRWYEEVLGWSTSFLWPGPDAEEPSWYGGVCLGDAEIHLNARDKDAPRVGKVYIYADDVDALAAAIKARGGELAVEPRTYAYGMRDFTLYDPAGNQLSFGQAAGA